MSAVTFDGTNAAEIARHAGGRYEGAAVLVRDDGGKITVVHEGYVLERREDGGVDIYSPSAYRRRLEEAA